jgi:hypothetical protein
MTYRGVRYAKHAAFVAAIGAATLGYAHAADMPVKVSAPPPPPPLFFVNENSLSYSYQFTATNPGAGKTGKNVFNYTHFDVWAYGTNFLTIDYLKAVNGNPAFPFGSGTPSSPCDGAGPSLTSCSGYTEIYGLFRSTFGWNQISNSKMFAVGPLTNIEFEVGADGNLDNTTLASTKRDIVGGVQFDFMAPYKGFLNVSVLAYKEWQHDGFEALFGGPLNPGGQVSFNPTWDVEIVYNQPLGFLPPNIPLTFSELIFIHGPKGCGEPCDGSNGLKRTTEYFTQEKLSLDVGKMVSGKANIFSVWGAYRWWDNKFGIDPNQTFLGTFSKVPYTTESTFIAGATVTF